MSVAVQFRGRVWMPKISDDRPEQFVVAQRLPETWESSRCLGAQKSWQFMATCGRLCTPNLRGWMDDICGRLWTYIIMREWTHNMRRTLGFHAYRVATLLCAFYGRPRHVEVDAQNGCAHYEASMPRPRGHAHFDAPSAHETFHAPALPHAPSFSKISRKKFWKSTSYDPIFAMSEIDIGRCPKVRQRVH